MDDILVIRVVKSFDLNGRGAAWKESVSAKDGGAGVADVDPDAAPDVRDLKPDLWNSNECQHLILGLVVRAYADLHCCRMCAC